MIITCKCGNDCSATELTPTIEQWLEEDGWRKIDGAWMCPQCCGTEGMFWARIKRFNKNLPPPT